MKHKTQKDSHVQGYSEKQRTFSRSVQDVSKELTLFGHKGTASLLYNNMWLCVQLWEDSCDQIYQLNI